MRLTFVSSLYKIEEFYFGYEIFYLVYERQVSVFMNEYVELKLQSVLLGLGRQVFFVVFVGLG